MNSDRNCTICLTDLNTNHQLESIFSIDSKASTCLAYKIFQMTGIQMIQQKVGEFACEDCHDMLITIVQLEKEFADKFHMLDNNENSSSRGYSKLKQEIHSPKTKEQNLEVRKDDIEEKKNDLEERNEELDGRTEKFQEANDDLEEYKIQQNFNRLLNDAENQSLMKHEEIQEAVQNSDQQEADLENTEPIEENPNNLSIRRKRKGKPMKKQLQKSMREKPSAEETAELSEGEVIETNQPININEDQTDADEAIINVDQNDVDETIINENHQTDADETINNENHQIDNNENHQTDADETMKSENHHNDPDETSLNLTRRRVYRRRNPELKVLNRSRIDEKHEFQQQISNLKQVDVDGKELWQCDYCEKAFARRDGLITHRRFHTGEKPYSCEECGKCFSDNSNKHRHMKFHLKIKSYKCENCEKAFSTNQHLKKHLVKCCV